MTESLQILVEYIEKNAQVMKSVQDNLTKINEELGKTSQKTKTTGDAFASMQQQMASRVALLKQKYAEQDKAAQASTKNLKNTFTEINSAIALVERGLQKVKQGYEFAREGAQIDFTATKFERLAENIGTTADALMGDLKTATRGIYSDMELMATATDFVALGLAKDHEEAVRLARVAAGLNMNMNQLVLTLTNMTTMRFDAIGVNVDGFKEKVKGLESAGMDANAAFKEAFLQQAEGQLLRVGEAADSTIGSFMRFEAASKNMLDAAKKNAAEGIEPLIRSLADLMEAESAYAEESAKNDIYLEQAKQQLSEMSGEANIATSQAVGLARALEESARAAAHFAQEDAYLVGVIQESGPQIDAYADTYKGFISTVMTVQQEEESYTTKQEELTAKKVDLEGQLEAASGKKKDKIKADLDEVNDAIAENQAAHEAATNAMILNMEMQILAADGWTKEEVDLFLEHGKALGVFSAETVEKTKALTTAALELAGGNEEAIKSVRELGDTATAADLGVAGLRTGVEGAEVAFTNSLDPAAYLTDEIRELKDQAHAGAMTVGNLISQLDNLNNKTATATVNIVVNGSIPDFGGRNNLGGGGSALSGGNEARGGVTMAGGGQWKPGMLAIVGDLPGGGFTGTTEVITPTGRVLPNKDAKLLRELGLLDNAQAFALAPGGGFGGSSGTITLKQSRPSVGTAAGSGVVRDPSQSGTIVGVSQSSDGSADASVSVSALTSMVTSEVTRMGSAMTQATTANVSATDRQTEMQNRGNDNIVAKLDTLNTNIMILADTIVDRIGAAEQKRI